MNKKELEALINSKLTEFDNLMKDGKYADAKKVQNELNDLQAIYDGMAEEDPQNGGAHPKNPKDADPVDSTHVFAEAARKGFPVNMMSEGSEKDGGYTVPEDIQTRIEKYRDAKAGLRDLVRVTPVTTNKGAQTFKKRSQQTGFAKVGEGGKVGAKSTPQFERRTWEIDKYAGYFPITDEALEDSDANLVEVLVEWIGDESRVTDNNIILANVNKKEKTKLSNLDDFSKALLITLGQAFIPTSKIVTNDYGMLWLSGLKDNDNKPLLHPDPTEPMKTYLCIGVHKIEVKTYPASEVPCENIYAASTDTSVKAGKVYYTRTGSDSASYVYTAVESPSGKPSEVGYYELSKLKVPFIIGDLYEYFNLKDRRRLTIKKSDVAVVGSLNAFEEGINIWKAEQREGEMIRDEAAIVNGYVEIDA